MPSIIDKPKVDIAPDLLKKIKEQVYEQGQVVVHCMISVPYSSGTLIRIWPSTYLYDQNSSHISELVHAENISYFPQWQMIPQGESYFTLIFTGLPRSCPRFDLVEDCKGSSGAFKVLNVIRNEQDVYFVQF